jgi:predicted nucleic acid-binding protein
VRFVLDASVAVSWCFKDEQSSLASTIAQYLADGAVALAPMIWWAEVRNGVLMGERRGRSDVRQTETFVADLSCQRVDFDHLPQSEAVFALARRHRLTFYDAAYLELAQRERLPLATLDNALAAAAKAEGIALIEA